MRILAFSDLHRDVEAAQRIVEGTHQGSRAIHAAIDEQQPLLNLCGHIHFAWGSFGMLGSTRVHNLGPGINWFEV
jgi:hypothetical protein